MYSSFGASCSEVEINMLTGERRVLRADIMLDAGNSLSPAIDAGQASSALTSLHQHQNVVSRWLPALPLQRSPHASFASALQSCQVHLQLQEHPGSLFGDCQNQFPV